MSSADNTARKQRIGRPFKPGQSGNPNGRPKGARNKLTTEFFDDFFFLDVWQQLGKAAIEHTARNNPKDFMRTVAMLMPKEFEIKPPLEDLSDAELADLIAAVQTLIARGLLLEDTDGDGAAAKPH
jgi:Family of unknown function (DUF5681)